MMPRFNSIITGWPKPNQITATEEEKPVVLQPKDPFIMRPPDQRPPTNPNNTITGPKPNITRPQENTPEMEEYNQFNSDINAEGGLEDYHSGSGAFERSDGGNYQGTGKKQRGTGDRARLASNLSQGQSSSILTG